MGSNNFKKILFSLIIVMFLSINVVYAENCNALLTQEAADFLVEIITIIRYAVPVLLIILCTTDLVTVVVSQDDNAMKKSISRIVKRFIAAVAIFFVPWIIQLILGMDAIKDSLNLVDDPTCGIASGSPNIDENGEAKTSEGSEAS